MKNDAPDIPRSSTAETQSLPVTSHLSFSQLIFDFAEEGGRTDEVTDEVDLYQSEVTPSMT